MDLLEAHRSFYASLVTAQAGSQFENDRLRVAFGGTPRESFLGPGPWRVLAPGGYIMTPSAHPSLLYQDIVVALEAEGTINNGQPSLHALCLAALSIEEGESAVHVGAGSGYYTALLAQLVGARGTVTGYEIKDALARRAASQLGVWPNVRVHHRSGSEPPLPPCDVLYVSAGATAPQRVWLDALRPGGRLLFPLTPEQGFGAMLLVTRLDGPVFGARFLCGAAFIPCLGARDEATGERLSATFKTAQISSVHSLQVDSAPDDSNWFAGEGWWLSTRPVHRQT